MCGGQSTWMRASQGSVHLLAGGAVALALAAGLLAGCGGSAHASSPTTVMSSALAYANCMRSHGVPDFPDPNGQGEFQLRPVKLEAGRTTRSRPDPELTGVRAGGTEVRTRTAWARWTRLTLRRRPPLHTTSTMCRARLASPALSRYTVTGWNEFGTTRARLPSARVSVGSGLNGPARCWLTRSMRCGCSRPVTRPRSTSRRSTSASAC